MAQVSKLFTSMSSHGALLFECFMEYHDDDFREVNDDGDPDDFRVVRWFGTNYHTKPLIVTFNKGNGQNWKQVTIPAGEPYTANAGGAVKYEGDVPQNFFEWGV